ncbi:MAG: YopX family protein [Pseudomonadota bacterium]
MSQYKFKVWDGSRNEWLHDHPFNLYGETTLMGMIDQRRDGSFVKCAELNSLQPCQWTGLLDKAGVEIYEGDIVKFVVDYSFDEPPEPAYDTEYGTTCIDVVRLHEGAFYFFSPDGSGSLAFRHSAHCEVIGNIRQNPELLL